ncbi:hypothetical protein ONS95_002895 [Cadophora gregata]|uniref:uncharacterized protein n=1 Tax=Cadophora gregata TaxID=51156 RepID=UPI0026DD8A42|nr:uncharacterized protein ONS95_002895 [Cadophora gregata]KAK0108074.1 hypothetical protein ONS95_002895 [Cadophora gregata]KAK0109339.1 hypothetical protein ONS96_003158 [Cadophora gregata f. sp. sojae]
MGEIYKNSVLTIAADNCRDSNDSILGPVSTARVRNYTEQGCNSSKYGFQSKMYTYHGQEFGNSLQAEGHADISKGMLSSRAWALQEQILSPRTLQWAPLQLVWSCRHTTLSEERPSDVRCLDEARGLNYPESPPNQYHSTKMICLSQKQLELATPQTMFTTPGLRDINDPLQIWYLIVQQFLRRNITYEIDSLPAISGLAREVRRHTGYDYLVGLWSQDFFNGLLWSIDSFTRCPKVYVGPSWSWVSRRAKYGSAKAAGLGPNRFVHIFDKIDIRLDPVAEVMGTDIVYTTDDIFGPVKSATLRLKAPCLSIVSFEKVEVKLPYHRDTSQRRFYGDDPSAALVDDGSILCWLDKPLFEENQMQSLDAEGLRNSGAVVARVATLCGSRGTNVGKAFIKPLKGVLLNQNWSLILVPALPNEEKGEESPKWRRVGIARVADDLLNREDWETRELSII